MAGRRTITELAPIRTSYVTSQRIKACAYVRVSTEHPAEKSIELVMRMVRYRKSYLDPYKNAHKKGYLM